eukprot:5458-Eustigmatos_ZCMA.PRE.1
MVLPSRPAKWGCSYCCGPASCNPYSPTAAGHTAAPLHAAAPNESGTTSTAGEAHRHCSQWSAWTQPAL